MIIEQSPKYNPNQERYNWPIVGINVKNNQVSPEIIARAIAVLFSNRPDLVKEVQKTLLKSDKGFAIYDQKILFVGENDGLKKNFLLILLQKNADMLL